jgi:asparagine synthase (glutamine-hydrolysing)
MPGFSLLYNTTSNIGPRKNLVCGQLKGANFQLNRFTLNKFLDDKLFFEDDSRIIVIEGVILNKRQLVKENDNAAWQDVVWKLYKERGNTFFNVFRGSFSGLLYDKANATWVIFTDHIASKHIYYYRSEDELVISTEIGNIYDYLKEKARATKLNTNAAFMLLSYGYMIGTNTLCRDIKKLLPGTYILFRKDSFEVYQYYKLPQSTISDKYDEEAAIETLDENFRTIIGLQFEKDREYGYKHFVSLSGGLDSRMVSWVAHEMGYTDQINFTFSQSNYLDETTPKRISADLKHEWIFKALDNGLFLKDIDEINSLTGGNILYYGVAHSNSLYKLIDFTHLGIIHSGQVGEAIIGSIIKKYSKGALDKLGGAYSEKFIDHVQTPPVKFSDFTELEISLLYQRAFNGANTGYLSEQTYTEVMSPFCDIDFFEYCLSIPMNHRMNHKLYKKWILKKYPRAADYVWENTGRKITQKTLYVKVGEKKIPLYQLHSSILRKLGWKKKPSQTRSSMNPLDYWYASNGDIRTFQDNYFADNIRYLESFPELMDVCRKLYNIGEATEKNQVLTLLSAVKNYSLE